MAALLARTRQLPEANRALEPANRALHDAYDAKQEFADRLSHELRTPLSTEIVRSRACPAPRTMLHVEDMVENLRLAEQILSQRPSVTVLAAMLGRVALGLAAQHRPDVILLDLNLPDMAGQAVLAELRASHRGLAS